MQYRSGDWYAICDQCGLRGWASEMVKRWDGMMVHAAPHHGCFEHRHPQDFVRAVPDNKPLPWTRPDLDGSSIAPTINCTYRSFTYLPTGYLNTLTSDYTVVKSRIQGPVTIPSGITVTVECALEIE
jgi:hypothetical protein